ncbi:hypothetical protein [Nocardioides sp.]|uniref:hypothetical protein n=1 Tax=Nocardioides sp. TaxID=35761 RepID=UPI00262F4C06|nr:hypothetical protein [Nocardioides sp.]MCW2738979.1 hypothetical protein [Nocardioides sp.]
MNTDELSDLLRTLPPPMDGPPDRFEIVQRRARRRARTIHAGVAGGVAAAVVAATAALLLSPPPSTQSDGPDIATEPPSPTETVRYEDVGPLPGATRAIDLSEPVEVTGTGTDTVELGSRPDRATAANVSVVCLTAGRIVYPDGASIVCDDPASESEIADPRSANYTLIDLDPGQTSLRLRAKADVGWKVVANYVRTETSEWGVNAHGETFGVQRHGKSPDLIAVYTTDGKQGYAYVEDLDGRWPVPTSPADARAQQEANEDRSHSVPVYESDGETTIGEYTIGP